MVISGGELDSYQKVFLLEQAKDRIIWKREKEAFSLQSRDTKEILR